MFLSSNVKKRRRILSVYLLLANHHMLKVDKQGLHFRIEELYFRLFFVPSW